MYRRLLMLLMVSVIPFGMAYGEEDIADVLTVDNLSGEVGAVMDVAASIDLSFATGY
jgi:formate hydrogenlyase subunit 4